MPVSTTHTDPSGARPIPCGSLSPVLKIACCAPVARENFKIRSFKVSATKTLAASVDDLYAACMNEAKRKGWFPRGAFEASSQTKNKYLNGAWKKKARLNIGFYPKGAGKSQIAVQVSRLDDKDEVERERAAWRTALSKLQAQLEA